MALSLKKSSCGYADLHLVAQTASGMLMTVHQFLKVDTAGLSVNDSPLAGDHDAVGPICAAQQQGSQGILCTGKTQLVQGEQGQVRLLAHIQATNVFAAQATGRALCGPANDSLMGDLTGFVAQAAQ